MKKHLVLLFILFLCIPFWPSESYVFTVVPKNGVKLRSEPSVKSEVKALIPPNEIFQTDLKKGNYLNNDLVNDDILDLITHNEVEVDGLTGFWIKGTYQGETGYVFSAYLIPEQGVNNYPNQNNKELVVLCQKEPYLKVIHAGLNTFKTNIFLPTYHYYTITENKKKATLNIKETQPYIKYLVTEERLTDGPPSGPDEIGTSWQAYYTFPEEKQVEAIVLSHEILKESRKPSLPQVSKIVSYENEEPTDSMSTVHYNNRVYFFSAVGSEQNQEKYERDWFVTINQNKKFKISTKEMYFEHIKWAADLNNDGYLDFIIKYWQPDAGTEISSKMKVVYSSIQNKELSYKTTNFFY